MSANLPIDNTFNDIIYIEYFKLVNLSCNNIFSLNVKIFDRFVNMIELSINHTNVREMYNNFGLLPKLKSLYLDNNQISTLYTNLFVNMMPQVPFRYCTVPVRPFHCLYILYNSQFIH